MKYTALVLKENSLKWRSVLPRKMYFKELMPFHLKNRVAAKAESTGGNPCVPELSVFLACMKKTDFMETMCMQEFTAYKTCVAKERDARREFKEANKQGLLGTSGRQLTSRQANKIMEMYPQHGSLRTKTKLTHPSISYSDPLLNPLTRQPKN